MPEERENQKYDDFQHTPRGDQQPAKREQEKGPLGEEHGNNYGYGRLGERMEIDTDQAQPNENEYVELFDPNQYSGFMSNDGPHAGRGPRNCDDTSTGALMDEICAQLTRHGDIDATDIDVFVDDTRVTISGCVSSDEERDQTERVITQIEGVSAVINRLKVCS